MVRVSECKYMYPSHINSKNVSKSVTRGGKKLSRNSSSKRNDGKNSASRIRETRRPSVDSSVTSVPSVYRQRKTRDTSNYDSGNDENSRFGYCYEELEGDVDPDPLFRADPSFAIYTKSTNSTPLTPSTTPSFQERVKHAEKEKYISDQKKKLCLKGGPVN